MKKSTEIAIIAGVVVAVIISSLVVVVHLRQSATEGTEHANETISQKVSEAVNAITKPNTTSSEANESPEQLASEGNSNQYLPYMTMQTCQAINDTLPDPKCTPGAIDPAVTQDNIDSTICVSGYTKTVRPPVSVTEPLKLDSMKSYGFTDSPSNYEFDHLIPLELGGAPDDMKNLWPEPHSSSFTKDSLENYLHDQVCSGNMDLKTAQNEIATNWFNYWMGIKN